MRLKGNAIYPAQIVVVDDGGSAFSIRVLPGMPGRLGNREEFDPAILAAYPPGYRHLAYVQQAAGATVKMGLPGLTGPAVEALYAKGRSWLAG